MLKHQRYLIFISDLVSVLLSYVFANLLRFGSVNGLLGEDRKLIALGILYIAYLFAYILYYEKIPVANRSSWNNLKAAGALNVIMAVIASMILYLTKIGGMFSRLFFCYFFICNFVLSYGGRMLARWLAQHYLKEQKKRLVVFANDDNVLKVLYKLKNSMLMDKDIAGIVVMHEDGTRTFYRVERDGLGKSSLNSDAVKAMEFLQQDVVDEALLSLPVSEKADITELIEVLESMGINVYLTMNSFALGLRETDVESYGMYHVLSYSPRRFSEQELFFKRLLDIAGGFVGCLLCLLVGVFVAPAIWIEDPGPVLFKQKRVGRNGRQFDIYKFRSMYQDAEARKQELMTQNEMSGLMFKMKDDPRITKVGKFIRKTSLDEFPQFFNVLKGDMSLVGTRPPTLAEFNQYSAHHKRRLSLKPGITGLWQVSGRSDITDFEDVVRLDVEYIDSWTFWLDIKILLTTVWVVLTGKGSA